MGHILAKLGLRNRVHIVRRLAKSSSVTSSARSCSQAASSVSAFTACKYISEPHIYIENSLFKKNANNCWSTDPLSNDLGFGGAIALMDAGSLTVLNTTFIANSAAYGTAISAFDVELYGSPDIIIVNNSFINHTKHGDVLNVRVKNTILNISNNYYYGNSSEEDGGVDALPDHVGGVPVDAEALPVADGVQGGPGGIHPPSFFRKAVLPSNRTSWSRTRA